MPITADDLLELAEDILNAKNAKEVNFRNSAGRSYYAIFHFCKPLFDLIPEIESESRLTSHKKPVSKLKRSTNPDIRELGYLMDQGRVKRTIADYKIERKFHKAHSEKLLEFAKTVKAITAKIPANPPPL
jgi:uncharacterized protein (UPF0332 family)